MGKLVLYGLDASPPVRACLLTLKALELPFEYVVVNLLNKEHLSEDFLKKNPQHTVPVLDDGGDFIWDSHAICAYLVGKYGKNDSLYPKDLLKRAVVDQRLHFESGVVFQGALRNITADLFFKKRTAVPREKIQNVISVYDFLETFLKDKPFVAGDHLTIADFSLITSVSSLVVFAEIDSSKYPNVMAWWGRLKQLPYYEEANGVGATALINMIKGMNITIVD